MWDNPSTGKPTETTSLKSLSVWLCRSQSQTCACCNLQPFVRLQPFHNGHFLFASGEHLIKRVFTDGSFDAADPLVLLFAGGSWDSVKSVVALDNAAVCFCFTGFDHLVFVVGDEELKTVRFLGVLHFSDAEVLQWTNPSGLFVLSTKQNNINKQPFWET